MFFTQEDYRKIEEYLKQNSKKDTDFLELPEDGILAEEDVVAVVHKGTNYRIPIATLADVLERYRTDILKEKIKDLQNQIDSLEISGLALSNSFGDDEHIGISQKALTGAFNRIWAKLEEVTGEALQGFSLVVSPEYYIGEEGAQVHITATSALTNGPFEDIKFFINGELVVERKDVDFFEFDTTITETSVVQCTAKIMGVEYNEQRIITHYNSFWMGAGRAYTDIMNFEHIIPVTSGMRAAHDVTFQQGDRLFVIVGDSLREGFLRADMNGIEIKFNESSISIDGTIYKVFTSDNTFNAGTYNIDING